MAESANKGKIKVGIDWENKGWVDFSTRPQDESDSLNLFFHPDHWIDYLTFTGSTIDTRIIFAPLQKYGIQALECSIIDENGTIIIGGFDIGVTGSQEYSTWFWLSSEEPYVNVVSETEFFIVIAEYDNTDSVVTSTIVNPDLIGDREIQAVRVHYTTDPTSTYIRINIGRSDNHALPLTYTVWGMMQLEGDISDEPVYNNGEEVLETVVDNDITNYVELARGSLGKSRWENLVFDEGTLSLSLNNADKRFSPEYSGSPYFGYILPYLRIWVAFENSYGVYELAWSGWTHQFSVDTGTTGGRQATYTARQGLYNVRAQDPNLLLAAENQNSRELIRYLFSGGYQIPSQPEGINVPNVIWEYADEGINIPLFGAGFVGQEEKSYEKALGEVSELNGNFLFLTRQGRINFKSVGSLLDETPDELPLEYTTHINYVYAPQDLYRQIIVNYDVFSHDDDIEMQGQEEVVYSGAVDFPFRVNPKYNGKPLIGDVILDVSSFVPSDSSRVATSGGANAVFNEHDEGIYTWYDVVANNDAADGDGGIDYRLSLVSRESGNVWYASEVGKQYIADGDHDRSLDTLTYSNSLITTDGMAGALALLEVTRRAAIVSWFDRATLTNRSGETVDFYLQHPLNSVIYVREEQTGNVAKALVIIQEAFTYSSGYLQVDYSFAPTGGEVVVADFAFDIDGQDVQFENLSVENETDYAWDFDDAGTSTDFEPLHTYATKDTFVVELLVTISNGQFSLAKKPVKIKEILDCDFSYVADFQNFDFTDLSISDGGTITTWSWEFGDELSGSSVEQNPSYHYAEAGTFTVQLTIGTADGGHRVCTQDVDVEVDPDLCRTLDFSLHAYDPTPADYTVSNSPLWQYNSGSSPKAYNLGNDNGVGGYASASGTFSALTDIDLFGVVIHWALSNPSGAPCHLTVTTSGGEFHVQNVSSSGFTTHTYSENFNGDFISFITISLDNDDSDPDVSAVIYDVTFVALSDNPFDAGEEC